MARKRDIAPELWANEQLGSVPPEARLLFLACISAADDEGRLKGSARFLKGQAFRYDEHLNLAKVAAWSDALERAGLVCRYTAGGGEYIHLPTWHKWQKINRPYPSTLPECPLQNHSLLAHCSLTAHSLDTATDTATEPGTEPGPGPDTATDTPQKRSRSAHAAAAAAEVPIEFSIDEQDRINAAVTVLAPRGFDSSPEFWRKVLDKYGALDVDEEALKAVDWLKRHSKRQCSQALMLNWFKIAMEAKDNTNGRTNANGKPEPYSQRHHV